MENEPILKAPYIQSTSAPLNIEDLPQEKYIIKVVGVGGGGGNAANYIYRQQLEGIGFVAINTDRKALNTLDIPDKIAISELGSGCDPELSRAKAEEFKDRIADSLRGVEMAFITAGLGKGTGTGASPVVARIAREMGILTVGVVTIPFRSEGRAAIMRAINGLDELRKNVDAILIIANNQIQALYKKLPVSKAFDAANEIVATAINGIAGSVTRSHGITTDMEDMRTTLDNGKNIMMGVGVSDGDRRAIMAIRTALDSPLMVNNKIRDAERIIINYSYSMEHEITIDEIETVNDVLCEEVGYYGDQIWGTTIDESLDDKLKVTVIITGLKGASNEELVEITNCRNQKVRLMYNHSSAADVAPDPSSPYPSASPASPAAQPQSQFQPQPQNFVQGGYQNASVPDQAPSAYAAQSQYQPQPQMAEAYPQPQAQQPALFAPSRQPVVTSSGIELAAPMQRKRPSLADLDNEANISELERPAPAADRIRQRPSDILVGNSPDGGSIRRNNYLDNNVD